MSDMKYQGWTSLGMMSETVSTLKEQDFQEKNNKRGI
jgi:hypothetical protein